MTGRVAASLISLLAFLFLSPGALAEASGSSTAAPPGAFTILHTANGLGELSPCG